MKRQNHGTNFGLHLTDAEKAKMAELARRLQVPKVEVFRRLLKNADKILKPKGSAAEIGEVSIKSVK